MAGVLRLIFVVAISACLHACASLYEAAPTITGNNTGGVIPQKMAANQDVQALATAHCAKWGTMARITFPASQTSGEVVFVCETPAQAARAMQQEPEAAPKAPQIKSGPPKKRTN